MLYYGRIDLGKGIDDAKIVCYYFKILFVMVVMI